MPAKCPNCTYLVKMEVQNNDKDETFEDVYFCRFLMTKLSSKVLKCTGFQEKTPPFLREDKTKKIGKDALNG